MKKTILTIALVVLTFMSCTKDDDTQKYTLEINVNYKNEQLNKINYEDGAEVYVYEFVEAWKNSPNDWEYSYIGNGYIKSNLTNKEVSYSQFKLTSIGTAIFQLPEGNHTVVVKSNKMDDSSIFKINMDKDKVSTHEFK